MSEFKSLKAIAAFAVALGACGGTSETSGQEDLAQACISTDATAEGPAGDACDTFDAPHVSAAAEERFSRNFCTLSLDKLQPAVAKEVAACVMTRQYQTVYQCIDKIGEKTCRDDEAAAICTNLVQECTGQPMTQDECERELRVLTPSMRQLAVQRFRESLSTQQACYGTLAEAVHRDFRVTSCTESHDCDMGYLGELCIEGTCQSPPLETTP